MVETPSIPLGSARQCRRELQPPSDTIPQPDNFQGAECADPMMDLISERAIEGTPFGYPTSEKYRLFLK